METEPIPPTEEITLTRELYTESHLADNYETLPYKKTPKESLKAVAKQFTPRCIGNQLLGYLPIIKTVKNYRWREWAMMDAIAGLSAAFIHLPQCLGYSILASLTPVYGLYSTFFPIVVYIFTGTSPHVSMGTNALFCLLTAGLVERELQGKLAVSSLNDTIVFDKNEQLMFKVDHAAAACLVAGLILGGMGLLRMGFLTNFMSKSFIGGFTFSAAVHIATSQVGKLLALKLPVRVGIGKLVMTWIDIFSDLPKANPADIIIGLISIAILLGVKVGINERFKDKLKFPIPIELIVVIASTLVSHYAGLHDKYKILIVGSVPSGFPTPRLPPLEYLPSVSTDGFVMAILIFVLNISLAKLTAKLHDIEIDDNQELVSYGACQIVGAFFGNIPSSTSPPRTMLLSSSGSKSSLNGVTSAVFIFIVMMWAGVLFVSLPIAMLAGMIIVAMKDLLLQVRNLRPLWRANKADFWIWVLTALSGILLDLDIGLLVGVVFSMITVITVSQMAKGTLYGKAHNEDVITELRRKNVHPIPGVKIFRFESALYFASQERFKNQIYKRVMDPCMKKENAVVKVVMEVSAAGTQRAGCAGRLPFGRRRARINSEQYDEYPAITVTSVSNNNNTMGMGMAQINKGFQEDNHVDLGDGVTESPAVIQHQAANEDTHHLPLPTPGSKYVQHSAPAHHHDTIYPHPQSHATTHDGVTVNGTTSPSSDGNSSAPEILDIEELPPDHFKPRKSLHGEIVFEPSSNVKVAEPEPELAELHFLVLDCSCVGYIDVSGMDMLQTIIQQFTRAGVEVLMASIPRKTLSTLRRAQVIGPNSKVTEEKVFYTVLDAVHSIKRAQDHRINVKF